jgi:hypothetical protein
MAKIDSHVWHASVIMELLGMIKGKQATVAKSKFPDYPGV